MLSEKSTRKKSGGTRKTQKPPASPLVRTCVNQLCDLATKLVKEHGLQTSLGSEARLCQHLSLSRTPLRQALEWLCEAGLIERSGRSTLIVRLPQKSDYVQVDEEESLSKADQCEQWILQAIADRRLRPGQRFTEIEIAEAADVTTPTVRAVLAGYEVRRLFEKDPRKSWRMVCFNQETIRELWEVRRLVESHALACLCQGIDAEQLAAAKKLLQQHRSFAKNKRWHMGTFRKLDQQFHQLLFTASSNRFLEDLRVVIDLLIHVQLADDEIGREGMSRGVREHSAILEAILAGNSKQAQAELSKHMDSSEYIMNQSLSRDNVE